MTADRVALLHEVSLPLTVDLDRRWLLDAVVRGARRLLDVPIAATLSWDAMRGEPLVEAIDSDETVAPLLAGPDLAAWVTPAFNQRATAAEGELLAKPRPPPLARTLRLDAVAAVPLVGSGVAHGVVFVARRSGGAFAPDDLRLLEIFAAHAGLALANADAVASGVRRLAQAEALAGAFRDIAWARDRDTILQRGLDCATSILGADRAAVYLLNSRQDICFVASRRLSRGYVEEVTKRYRRSVGGILNVERTPIFVPDMATDPRSRAMHEMALREGVHTTLIMPILQRGQLYGAIALYHDLVWRYEPEDHARARALADEMAVALANAALHQATQRQLANLRLLEPIARAAAEPGTAAERAQRVVRLLVERGGARRAWVVDDGLQLVAAAGESAPSRDDVHQAAQAALLAGGPIVRGVPPTMLVAAPLRSGAPLGALVYEPMPPAAVEQRPPALLQILADEADPGHDLELAGAAASHLAVGMAVERAPAPRAAAVP